MQDKIQQFLDAVCAQMKYPSIHQEVRDELFAHINDIKAAYTQQEYSEEAATESALADMGNANDIGKRLNKIHKPQTEWSIIALLACIALFGVVIMYASSSYEQQVVNFSRYIGYALVGVVVMVGLYYFDYTKLCKYSGVVYAAAWLLFIATSYFGDAVNGRRYLYLFNNIRIGSEVQAFLFILAFAGLIERHGSKGRLGLMKLFLLAAASLIPVASQNLVQAICIIGVYFVLSTVGVCKKQLSITKKSYFIGLGILASCGIFAISKITNISYRFYRIERIKSMFKFYSADEFGVGYQSAMAWKWLYNARLLGKAQNMNGMTPDYSLPELPTNFALVNITVTLGWVFCIAFVLLAALLIARMLLTTLKIKNSYGFYLSLAAFTSLSYQFICGILINLSMLPVAGISIPFISYGAQSYIMNMALAGLILSVWRRNKLIPGQQISAYVPKNKLVEYSDGKLIIHIK